MRIRYLLGSFFLIFGQFAIADGFRVPLTSNASGHGTLQQVSTGSGHTPISESEVPEDRIIIPASEGYKMSGRWRTVQQGKSSKLKYEYFSATNQWASATDYEIAKTDGEFTENNVTTRYLKGDIIFIDATGKKNKAKPLSLQLEDEGYCADGKYDDSRGNFLYLDSDGKFYPASHSYPAEKDGYFINIRENEVVFYKKGELLFESKEGYWCKSDANYNAAPTDYVNTSVVKNQDTAYFTYRGKQYQAPVELVTKPGSIANKEGKSVPVAPNDLIVKSPELGNFKVAERFVQEVPHEPSRGILAENFVKILNFARANLGRKVGSGWCDELTGTGGAEIGQIVNGKIIGKIVPGAVLVKRGNHNRDWHWMLIENFDEATQKVTILQQNVSGGPVQRDIYPLDHFASHTHFIRVPTNDRSTAKLHFLTPGLD